MQIALTQEHINKGKPGYGNCCATALAIKSHPDINHVNVGIDSTNIEVNKEKHQLQNNMPLFRFIKTFDDKEKVEPGTITIDLKNNSIHYTPESEAK